MHLLARMRIASRLHLIVTAMIAGLILVGGGGVLALRENLIEDRQEKTRDLVQTALSVVRAQQRRALSGEIDELQAKREALAALAAMRYDGDNYFWVNDLQPRMVMHPQRPDLDGRDLSDFHDADGVPLFVEFAKVALEKGSGYVFYRWPKPGHEAPVAKLSYVEAFAPWGWVVGSGTYLDDVDAIFRNHALRFAGVVLLGAVGTATLAWMISRGISQPLGDITRRMVRLAGGERGHKVPYVERVDEIGDLARALNVFGDNTECVDALRRQVDETVRLANAVFNTTSEAIVVTDHRNRIKAVNPAFTRITGYAPAEVLGQDPKVLESGRHEAEFFSAMWASLREGDHWEGEIWNRRKNGEVYPEWLSITPIRDHDGEVVEYVAVFTDLNLRRREEERIRWHANHDALTELPNRKHVLEALAQAMGRARGGNAEAALLLLDIDHFKAVNESLGHAVGDKLLQMVAKRLRHAVRETDVVGRLGGDQFTVLLEDLGRGDEATLVCAKIIQSLGQPFHIDGQVTSISASIGIAVFPTDADAPVELLEKAGNAMYRAKQSGRNNYRFFAA